MSCPEPLLLSQLLDGEVAPDEAVPLRAHVDTCPRCQERMERLENAATVFRAGTGQPPALVRPPATDCPTPDRLAAWAARVSSPEELAVVDGHLERCDACLEDALGALRLASRLDAGPALAVPGALQARVASRWSAAADQPLAALVIRVARAGVALLERHVVAPVLDIEDLSGAAPAVRGARTETVSFRIRAPEAQICASVFAEGDAVGLTLTLLGNTDDALGGQRVFLRRNGRSIYSARTDAAGALTMPRIEPGVYEVSCPGIATRFRLDLRP